MADSDVPAWAQKKPDTGNVPAWAKEGGGQNVPAPKSDDSIQGYINNKMESEEAFDRAMKNLFTMGLAQPTEALASSATGKNYDKSLEQIKEQDDSLAKKYPTSTFLGGATGLVGSLGTGVGEAELAGEGAAKVGGSVLERIGQQGVKNIPLMAGIGGVTGAANQPGDLTKKAVSGAIGSAVGTAASFVPPAIGEGASAAVKPISAIIQNLFKDEQANTANQIVRGAVQSLGTGKTSEESSSDIRQILSGVKDADSARTKAMWEASGINEKTPIPVQPLKDGVKKYIQGLTKADQTIIPKQFSKILSSFNKSEPLRELQGLRSKVTGWASKAYREGDNNSGRVLSQLEDMLEEHTETPALTGLSPEQTQKYVQARQATREMKQAARNKYIDKAIGISRTTGEPKTDESKVGDIFVKKGSPESLDSFLSYLNRGNSQEKQTGIQSVRNLFAQKMLDASASKSIDVNDNPFVNLEKMGKFIDDHKHIVNSEVFDENQKKTLNALSSLSRGASKPLNSNSKMMDFVLSRTAGVMTRRGAGEVIGGVVGGALGHVPGAVAGAMAGGELGTVIMKAPQQKMANLVMEAIKDPEIAAALQTAPREITPKTGMKILSILGSAASSKAIPAQIQQNVQHYLSPSHPLEQSDAGVQ